MERAPSRSFPLLLPVLEGKVPDGGKPTHVPSASASASPKALDEVCPCRPGATHADVARGPGAEHRHQYSPHVPFPKPSPTTSTQAQSPQEQRPHSHLFFHDQPPPRPLVTGICTWILVAQGITVLVSRWAEQGAAAQAGDKWHQALCPPQGSAPQRVTGQGRACPECLCIPAAAKIPKGSTGH